jgi:hypothetical protein
MDIDDLMCYHDAETDKFVYSEMKEKYLEYNYNLCNHTYTDGLTLRQNYRNAKLNNGSDISRNDDDVILRTIVSIGFRELLEQYIELRENNIEKALILRYELENPLFKKAYDLLGRSGIASCKYVEKKIKEQVFAKSDDTMQAIYTAFYKKVGADNFITLAEAKKVLRDILTLYNVKGASPKVTMLNQCYWFKLETYHRKVNGSKCRGIILKVIFKQAV